MSKKVETVVAGTVVTEQGVVPDCRVAIAGGKVVGLFSPGAAPEASERIDCPGCLLLPGRVDAHVHSLGEATEGFANSTRAAAAGGTTTIVDMPTDRQGPVLTARDVAEKARQGESQALVDFALWAAVRADNQDQIESLARAGVVGFKMFMSESVRGGRIDDGSLLAALGEIARVGGVGAVHAESFEITGYLTRKYREEGRGEPEAHLASRPEVAEIEAVMRAVEYARCRGADLHLCHLSLARSVEHVHRQRIDYPRLSVETCPQYLLLSEETLRRIGAYAKMNPPLRKVQENEALWQQVLRGRVDLIATDHGNHPHAEKTRPSIFDNKSGMPGVETALPLIYSEGVVKRELPVERLVSLLSAGPARRFGLYPRKGALLPGSDADLVVLDPRAEWEITASRLHQAAGWTAYEGMRVLGRPVLTMVRGRVVYRDGEILGKPGLGRFVASERAARASVGRAVP